MVRYFTKVAGVVSYDESTHISYSLQAVQNYETQAMCGFKKSSTWNKILWDD